MSTTLTEPNCTSYPKTRRHTLEFYALAKVDNPPELTTFYRSNMSTQDASADLLHRNVFSVRNQAYEPLRTNYKVPKTINEQFKETNNYMAPLTNYKTMERFHLPSNMTNKETYNIEKKKLFANDRSSSLQTGSKLTKDDYIKEKESSIKNGQSTQLGLSVDISNSKSNNKEKNIKQLKSNVLVFDKNQDTMLRNKGFWIPRLIAQNKTKISPEAPEWFDVVPESKIKEYNDYMIKNEDTMSVFSRYQNWITVTPRSKDRRKPLEKMRAKNLEQTSKIMPKWMELKQYPHLKTEEGLRPAEYCSMKNKSKKMMIWVDKDLNNKKKSNNDAKSIFSYGDFRHNLLTKEQARYYDTKVSQEPKKFFDWDDGKRFNPRFKTDQ